MHTYSNVAAGGSGAATIEELCLEEWRKSEACANQWETRARELQTCVDSLNRETAVMKERNKELNNMNESLLKMVFDAPKDDMVTLRHIVRQLLDLPL